MRQRGGQSRPHVEERLILLSAGTAACRRAAAGQVEELAAVANWSLVADLLRRRRLLTLLGPRLVELAGDRVGDDFAREVTLALDAGRRQGVLLYAIADRVTGALAAAGIRSTTLKGPALSEVLYGDPGRRPSSDIDLLIAREQLNDAVEVVRELGYEAPIDHVTDDGLPLLHFALVHAHGQLLPVELHWRIHWYEEDFAGERLLVPIGEPDSAWRPAPIDELVALLLFYARDGFIDLRLATDLGACWDAFGAGLRPGALDAPIAAHPALENVLLASARAAEKTVGLPADRLIGHRPRLGRRSRIAVALASPNPHLSQSQLYADVGLIDGLLAPPGGFGAFLRRQVIPPREVLREHAQKARKRRAATRLGNSLRVLRRYGLAMTRLRHAPEGIRPR